jgi:DEAD/DEAH box helicase domain-containing protein
MLPATLAQEVKKQVRHYLEATFPLRDPDFEAALGRFIDDPGNGLFKGPWLQLRRPYRLAADKGEKFLDLTVPFTPFRHQWLAWQRLTSKNHQPEPTIVTTGTGSGKTECFLYPILDHCLRQHRAGKRQGIKAIVLYPMNALAADQAGRFAEEILTSDQMSQLAPVGDGEQRVPLIRVGLYTGRMQPGQEDNSGEEKGTYTEVQIIPAEQTGGKPAYVAITNRQRMQEEPPDILLTNYKMLDYLLMRPKDQGIWQHNIVDSGLMQYLVLDELHTYDGAQGADVACLIRRLKARLGLSVGELCVVGTSATIASGDDESGQDPINRLCRFAESIFEEPISNDAVLDEDRLSIAEIIRHSGVAGNEDSSVDPALPSANDCAPLTRETAPDYARRIAPLFGAPDFPVVEPQSEWLEQEEEVVWSLAIGAWLREQPLFHHLLYLTEHGVIIWNDLVQALGNRDFAFREVGDVFEREQVLLGFLALLAQAKELRSGRAFPLIPTQVQFWLRELRRVGALVADTPIFNWLDQPIGDKTQLPVVHCTECGEAAWVALVDADMRAQIQQTVQGFAVDDDPQAIYQAWGFETRTSPDLVTISRWLQEDPPLLADKQLPLESNRYFLAPGSLILRLGPGQCPLTGESTFPVKVAHEVHTRDDGQRVGRRICPHCLAEDTLMFIGSRAATVASVSIDEIFGSTLNSDPKLLAFTDSVQDASHRAGFFSSRTYRFTLRTALQHVIDETADAGVPLGNVGQKILDYWSKPLDGRPGSLRETIATILPPDMREYKPYDDFRATLTSQKPADSLLSDIVRRLNWEVVSEFGLMQTHGRTMESQCSAALGWDPMVIRQLAEALKVRCPGISPVLGNIDEKRFELWIYGVLHRSRLRGAMYHEFLDEYAVNNFWGKYPFGRVVAGRETYPSAGQYRPRLITNERDRYHDNILAEARGNTPPWHLVWARRVLQVETVDETTLLDLFSLFLEEGVASKLLVEMPSQGSKRFYALNAKWARLYAQGTKLASETSGDSLYRPEWEADYWLDNPTMGYRDQHGSYELKPLNEREKYYQQRYRKGALRRVFAFEHTGMLTTEERETLEMEFNVGGQADDPNVLTATSTLEMGIDIGDLSTTMLCSIPPTVASYLQRIGRAGRSTGTALVLSVVNQKPHDLFFYARPEALLEGSVEPPGCWLDATAVLVRQYLAFCFDEGVKAGELVDLPSSGKQLVDEMILNQAGNIPDLLAWVTLNEASLQQQFLARFVNDVMADTREMFVTATVTERIKDNVLQAAQDFENQRRLLENARRRLNDQKSRIEIDDDESLDEIERERKILQARASRLGQVSALEVLTEHGLLPNYAFPERGVRFSGTTYNKHRDASGAGDRIRNYEITRSSSAAIRELAPANRFYTHSHVFKVQQLEVGSQNQPILEDWAFCGQCGYMDTVLAVTDENASPVCRQCGYATTSIEGLRDAGQHHACLPFHRSQAISYMEYYESLSADRREERESELYCLITSFDPSVAQASGAVGDNSIPFGIEYRTAIRMRELNTGYRDMPLSVSVGNDQKAPDGFIVCSDCGVVGSPGQQLGDIGHRRSCSGRRRTETMQQQGREGDGYNWQNTWLYRELRSEAVRLLLPEVEDADLDTLEACIYLGMRIRFQGDPTHLLVRPQIVPDISSGLTRHYLVLMDAVPGGTGFLKALFQETDDQGRAGEGIVDVMSLARNALESCDCNQLQADQDDTDGCYKCIRTYHLQHRSSNISRDRGIALLGELLNGAARRDTIESLDDISIDSLFDSVLEKRFVQRLKEWVEVQLRSTWQETLVNGKKGFRFLTSSPERQWELELQPLLGSPQGVAVQCQPDFMLRCLDDSVRPIAIFADGFEPHVYPGQATSRLPDDVRKRQSILASGGYYVWSLTWDDLDPEPSPFSYLRDPVVERQLQPYFVDSRRKGRNVPPLELYSGNLWQQLQAFILAPDAEFWRDASRYIGGFALFLLASNGRAASKPDVSAAFRKWQAGGQPNVVESSASEPWIWSIAIAETMDFFIYGQVSSTIESNFSDLQSYLRLDDSEELRADKAAYKPRWRMFLAFWNVMQFSGSTHVFATSDLSGPVGEDLNFSIQDSLSNDWRMIVDESLASLEGFVLAMAAANRQTPELEYYDDAISDDVFAEFAWTVGGKKVVFLVGDQTTFFDHWVKAGFKVLTMDELKVKGVDYVVDQIPERGNA